MTRASRAGGSRRARLGALAVLSCLIAEAAAGVAVARVVARPAKLPITVTVDPTVTPTVAGTPKRPQGVKIDVKIKIGMPQAYDPPLVDKVDVWFPHGGLYRGGAYPTCSRAILAAAGPSGCPKGSIMGWGIGAATADRVWTYPKITIVNGGQRMSWAYVVLNNPARVQEPIPAYVDPMYGRWSYHLHFRIPRNLQIVAGIPIVLHSIRIVVGGHGTWIASTSCPADHRWPWKGLGTFTDGQTVAAHGAVACTPGH